MRKTVPPAVLKSPPHSLRLVTSDSAVDFYVREDEFMQARYPQKCPLELALQDWDDAGVICVSLLVRLGGQNAGTFDRWLNPADTGDLRILQLLSTQPAIDLYLVSDRVFRSFRRSNVLSGKAAGLVATLRLRRSWAPEDFEEQRKRLDTLFPSADALWRSVRQRDRHR
jgi:hypothetical protein